MKINGYLVCDAKKSDTSIVTGSEVGIMNSTYAVFNWTFLNVCTVHGDLRKCNEEELKYG